MTLKSIRRRNLKKQGFFGWERREFVKLTFKRSPWLRFMRRDRASELEAMKDLAGQRNWSQTRFEREWFNYIKQRYIDNNWLTDGIPDAWKMFRALRDRAIKEGKWGGTPEYLGRRWVVDPETGLSHRIDKGDVKAQKARRREREKAKS